MFCYLGLQSTSRCGDIYNFCLVGDVRVFGRVLDVTRRSQSKKNSNKDELTSQNGFQVS